MVAIGLALAGAFLIGMAVYGYAWPSAQLFGRVHSRAKTADRVVAITFDDGPNDPYTSRLLDILALHKARATFFSVGANVERYPGTARRLVAEGHVIANHTYLHSANHALLNSRADILRTQEAISRVTGVRPRLYRPPHGKKTPWETRYLGGMGLAPVAWSLATNEMHRRLSFGRPEPKEVANHIIREARPGAIILLHDGYGTEHDNHKADKSLTVAVLPMILEGLEARGYRFVSVPEMLGLPAYGDPRQLAATGAA